MENPNYFSLPFPTRDQFNYGPGTVFQLECTIWTALLNPIKITGTTRTNPFVYNLKPTGNIDAETFTFEVEDIPIFLSAQDDFAYNQDGTVWLTVYLLVNGTRVLKMLSGYVTSQRGLSWPYNQGLNPAQEMPLPFWDNSFDPAAGSEFDFSAGASQAYVVEMLGFKYVADANVANRRVHLRLENNLGNVIGEWWSNTDQTAGTTKYYVCSNVGVVQSETDNGIIVIATPPRIVINQTMHLKTKTTNHQATDAISEVNLLFSTLAMKP